MADGDCYQVAGRAALDGDDFTVCHGVAIGRGAIQGQPFDHAWLERNGRAIDRSNGLDVDLPVGTYYALGGIDPEQVQRYTPDEAREHMRTHGHFGPWPH